MIQRELKKRTAKSEYEFRSGAEGGSEAMPVTTRGKLKLKIKARPRKRPPAGFGCGVHSPPLLGPHRELALAQYPPFLHIPQRTQVPVRVQRQ
jgi:hypothetical protein